VLQSGTVLRERAYNGQRAIQSRRLRPQGDNGITTYTIIAQKMDDIIKRSTRQFYDGSDYMTATISMASKISKGHKTFSWDITVLHCRENLAPTLLPTILPYVERGENEENRIEKHLHHFCIPTNNRHNRKVDSVLAATTYGIYLDYISPKTPDAHNNHSQGATVINYGDR